MVATQNKIFRLFHLLADDFSFPLFTFPSTSLQAMSVFQFSLIFVVFCERHKWIFSMGLTTECYGREFCNAKIFKKNTALTKHIFKIPPKHTQLLHDYCIIGHVT